MQPSRLPRAYASTSDSNLKVQPSNAPVIEAVVNAAPLASAIPKIIKGDFFAGASNLEFHGEGDYNQIAGDYVEDVYADDASFDTEDNPESKSVKQGQTKGKAPARPFPTGPTPELAPGTVVEGEFFAASHHFTVGGTARFNTVKGNFVKTRSNRRTAPNGPARPTSRPAPSVQAAPPNYEQRETPVIKGNFFAAAHTAVFDGNHEFNSISGDMIQTKYYTFEADKHDGYMDEDP